MTRIKVPISLVISSDSLAVNHLGNHLNGPFNRAPRASYRAVSKPCSIDFNSIVTYRRLLISILQVKRPILGFGLLF